MGISDPIGSPRPPPGAQGLSGAAQRWRQGLWGGAGWLSWAGLWLWALSASGLPAPLQVLLVATLVLAPALTLAWVAHNVGVYLRKGPRRKGGLPQPPPLRDAHGRRIEADWRALRRAGWIEVDVRDGVKCYGPGGLGR